MVGSFTLDRVRQEDRAVTVFVAGSALLLVALVISPLAGTGIVGRIILAGWMAGAAAIALVDLREHRIPNRAVLLLAGAAVLGLVIAAIRAEGWSGVDRALQVLLGAAAVAVALFALHLVSGGGLGMDDVKLSFPMSIPLLWYGVTTAWLAVVLTVLSAVVVVVGRTLLRRPQTPLPMAPFLVVGATLALVVHP